MKSIYLTVIVILASTVLTAQIQEVPIIGNPILQKLHQEEMAKMGIPEQLPNAQLRGDCPIEDPRTEYLFPDETFFFELDLSNKQEYVLVDSASALGSISIDTSGAVTFTAGNTTGAAADTLVFERTIDGVPSDDLTFSIIVKRENSSLVLPTEILQPGEGISLCAEPTSSLPGTINCTDIFACADDYGGNGLQTYFLDSGASDENCYQYFSSRFPGSDTICVVLCDEFTVCDTFKQPFSIVGDTLTLATGAPFFEDFSDGEPRPNSDFWLENLTFVNQTMPYNPPSIGVATFDGLDASGRPYGNDFGTADRLTSKPFDLSKENAASSIVLSFYYQLKGRGFQPRLQDSLILEYWTKNNEWVQGWAAPGESFFPANNFPPFEFVGLVLDNPDVFHDGFQFRFRNLNEGIGAYGVWHLDYIKLVKGGDPTNQGFDDIAFSEPPGSVLENYTAMPIHQLEGFEDKEIATEVDVKFFNNFNTIRNPGDTRGFHSENLTGNSWQSFTLTNATNYPSQEIFESTNTIPSANLNPFLTDLKTLTAEEEKLELKMEYYLTLSQAPEAFQNDTVSTVTHIDNYYAYDDGTAERAIDLNGLNSEIALEFEANVPDAISGVKIHFPYTSADFSNQEFDIVIRTDLNADPIYELKNLTPSQPNFLQSFASYELTDSGGNFSPIPVGPGKFYIGIRNTTANTPAFAIGYDKNNEDATSKFWSLKDGTTWTQFDDIITFRGALMIRPVMGGEMIASIENSTEQIESPVALYPNPAKDVLNFRIDSDETLESYNLQIFNALGQIIHQDVLASQLPIAGFLPGIYLAKITNLNSGNVQNLQFFKEK